MEKVCRICKNSKDIGGFAKTTRNSDGHSTVCKTCYSDWYKNVYKPKNVEKIRQYHQKYHTKNAEKICLKSKRWKENNELYKEKQRIYRENNKEAINKKSRKKYQSVQKLDPFFMLSSSMRASINNSLKGVEEKRGVRWEMVTRWNLLNLSSHLESLFEEDMTWENYGRTSGSHWWEVGHRIPIKAFRFSSLTDEEFCLCWSLQNLFPQWQKQNRTASDKVRINGQWKRARDLSESERLQVVNDLRNTILRSVR